MDAREFYNVALEIALRTPPAGPAWCRTAIGRAYYATLIVTVESLEAVGVRVSSGPNKHIDASRLLHQSSDAQLRTAAATLDNLKTERHRADYEMNRSDVETITHARRAVQDAKDILAWLDAFVKDPARMAATKASIESYKKKLGTP
jgi:hypothetical protein